MTERSGLEPSSEQDLRDEIARLNKVIAALVGRVERNSSAQRSDFGMFQSTVMLEKQVRERTEELEQALRDNEKINRALQNAKAQMDVEMEERRCMETELRLANEALTRLSLLDGLTGISNRRYFDDFLAREWQRAKRESTMLSVILADVDCFKAYNDTYGHLAGDACLKAVAGVLKATPKRALDLVARYGGEEFIIVLPGTDLEGAMLLAEKARAGVEALQIELRATTAATACTACCVTVSLGVASLVPQEGTPESWLVAAADAGLYRAKSEGRNRVATDVPPP